MDAKTKARDLVSLFATFTDKHGLFGEIDHKKWLERQKKCATICANQFIAIMYENGSSDEFTKQYWRDVVTEIEKIEY